MIERRPFTVNYLLVLIGLLCFIATECVAQAWLTKGTVWEWAAGGFIAVTAAKLV